MKTWIPIVVVLAWLVADRAGGQDFLRQNTQQQNNFVYRPRSSTLQQPTVSPYIGLLRRGSGTGNMGLNYFSIVRPEIQTRDSLNRQQREQSRLAQETQLLQQHQQRQMMIDPNTQVGANPLTGASRTIRPTGHATTIMNLQGRFGTR